MSRVAKWKLEKNKVKVVFRLQFHATHIPPIGWDKLFISFFPADSGKATAKTTKANVRNGACKWADPIYENTRLLQDAKTKSYDDKLYKLVVAMGSSRSSLLGEATINLADYADALKPYAVALPLHGTDSGTILHVTVQLLTSKTGFREFEQQRELRERGLQTTTNQNSHDESGVGKILNSEETVGDQMDKVNARVRFKPDFKELPSLEEEAGLNEDYADSTVGFDGSSNASESLYAEKQETSSAHEIDSLKSTISGDLGGLSLNQSPQPEKADSSDHQFHGWGSDYSVDNDLAIAYEENSRLRHNLELAESSIFDLKLEVSSLQSHVSDMGAETQKFTEQIAAEIVSGEELAKEVAFLRSECSKFKDDLERLKSSKLNPIISGGENISTHQDHLFQDLQFRWINGFLLMEDKLRELQNKACLGFHERDFRFLHPDFEALHGVLQDLKQGIGQAISLLNVAPPATAKVENRDMGVNPSENFVSETDFNVNLYEPEDMLHLQIPGLVSPEPDSIDAGNAMESKIFELLRELDESKAERENLTRKMDQMECYYEALIQELEENQKQMLGELQNLRNEHSTCFYTISSTKAQMDTMHQDMNEQILRLSEDRENLDSLNKELERRAIASEAALKRARLNYSIAVDQLQKDLELLSFQVLSMFETNESLIRQTYAEASQPCFQGYIDTLQNHSLGSKDSDGAKLLKYQNQSAGVKKQSLGGDILLEDLKRSLHLQEDLYQKVEEELCELHVVNLHLDVFSKTLQETLFEATCNIKHMKQNTDELAQQLELSTKTEEFLVLRLQNAMDDVHSLNEYKVNCIASCDDMALQNKQVEAKLESVFSENCIYRQKITELEALIDDCRSYENKYQACAADRAKLANLLKQETLENGARLNEMSSLAEELKIVRTEFGELVFVKENLLKIVSFVQDKLGSLLASYDNRLGGQPPWNKSLCEDLEFEDFKGLVLQLEERQHVSNRQILQLMKERKDLEEERDIYRASLRTEKSEILFIKQKFEYDMQEMVNKLDISNALVQKLQSELEVVANRVNVRSEAEEQYLQQNTELFSDLARFEVELKQVTSKNRDLAQEISMLETLTEELETSKLTVGEFMQENQALMTSLQNKTEESVRLALEHSNLKENLRSLHDELLVQRENNNKLEGVVTDLSCKLNEKYEQLLHFDQQKAELVYFKQLVSDLELEKSKLSCHLLQCEDHLQKVLEDYSSISGLESQLSEMHELLIAADVKLIFTKLQFEGQIKDIVQKLQYSDRHFEELRMQHLDLDTRLHNCLAGEKQYFEESARLLTTLASLKSDLNVSITQNRVLQDSNHVMKAELEEYKKQVTSLEVSFLEDESQTVLEVEQLKCMLKSSEEEIDNLIFSHVELEIKDIVHIGKLDEQCAWLTLLEENDDELVRLRAQCDELSQNLSEQILKTEEFKKLSVHLKELKDRAEAECLQSRGKKETEGPSVVAMQDSLRIAFIKEQYETKLQELRHQLSISKKHGEEMLWKLQDAIDEIENRKKSEASHLKRNEELSLKILELETELQSIRSDKREKIKVYDQIKAELECLLISLECCKEEKKKLEASLQDCNEEKFKIGAELNLMKKLLESPMSLMNIQREGNDGLQETGLVSGELVTNKDHLENCASTSSCGRIINLVSSNGSTGSLGESFNQECSVNSKEVAVCSISYGEDEHPKALLNMQPMQDGFVYKGEHEILGHAVKDQENLLHNDTNHLVLMNDHFKARSLKSSMDYLHKELERMINENLLFSQDNHLDPSFQGLQNELMQLHKANEELGNIFPLYNEFPVSGNAFERVLALEIELAEALQSKKKSSIHFQSSFLKQHDDEEAVFQSFRDINELIKDMLELKGRNTAVETELKDMHDRYSQLSLQFAEVEGERQKLMMTLKNVRASKKTPQLTHSSSPTPGDNSS